LKALAEGGFAEYFAPFTGERSAPMTSPGPPPSPLTG
jgi:hypothetical protein